LYQRVGPEPPLSRMTDSALRLISKTGREALDIESDMVRILGLMDMRLDTVSLRGLFNQQIHGSKRSLRSVEDFTEFEQRTAYFNGDEIHAIKKGMNILDRIQVSHMAQMQNMRTCAQAGRDADRAEQAACGARSEGDAHDRRAIQDRASERL
jgi:hypothetical protein